MPNHETNHVVVIGDPARIKTFLDEAFADGGHNEPDRVLDFEKILPPPEGIETGGCSGHHEPGVICWYEWNIANWGTKWGAYSHQDVVIAGNEEQVQVRLIFDTAWTQPTPIFEAIEKRWEVEVNAITLDEGGAPPAFYGDNTHDYLYVSTSVEFE